MPGMELDATIRQEFPIYPGITGVLEGGLGGFANFGFGFDNNGLLDWADHDFRLAESARVFDGFYIADKHLDDNGNLVDLPELGLSATMGAGGGLNAAFVRADVIGGLNAGATFDLIGDGEISDPNSYTGRIRAAEIANKLSTNPLDLFQLAGDLSAFLSAQVQLGIDLGFTQQWNTVWREELARIPIFQFGVGGSYGSGTASNGTLVGGGIYFDGDVDLKLDDDEPFTSIDSAGNFILPRIDHNKYDSNQDGSISPDEGYLITDGGTDTSTGLESKILPRVCRSDKSGQSMVTPVSTVQVFLKELGSSQPSKSMSKNSSFGKL